MTRLALLADLDRCTGCLTCVVACKAENRLGQGLTFIRVRQVGPVGEFPELSMYYLPVACQQCRRPACAPACAEGAIGRTPDGAVSIDPAACTGCGDCIEACPYGAIVLDRAQMAARKCDLCAELRAAGDQPACVALCPGRALTVVDLDAAPATAPGAMPGFARPVGRGDVEPLTLKPAAGTDPAGRFILTCQPWRGDE